jgi:hypothetical protein
MPLFTSSVGECSAVMPPPIASHPPTRQAQGYLGAPALRPPPGPLAAVFVRPHTPTLPGYGFLWNSPSYGFCNITASSIEWFSNATVGALAECLLMCFLGKL